MIGAGRSETLLILPRLDGLLQSGDGAVAATLQRETSSAPSEVALSPGTFRKAVYTLRLPDGVSGIVTLELVGLVANRAVLQITPSPSPDAAVPVSAPPAGHGQWQPAARDGEGAGSSELRRRSADTVREIMRQAEQRFASTGESFDRLTRVTAIAVNGVLVNYRKGMKTRLRDGDRVTFLKAAAGG